MTEILNEFDLSEEVLQKLEKLRVFMTAYNVHTNLTRITDPRDVYVRHYLDSLTAWEIAKSEYWRVNNADADKQKPVKVADIGSGAGFPGLVIAMASPNTEVLLIDSTKKRTEYLKAAAREVGATVQIEWARAEELSKNPAYRGKYDIAMSRAVAKLNKLSGWCMPYLKRGGVCAAMKSADIAEEIAAAAEEFAKQRGKNVKVHGYTLQSAGEKLCRTVVTAEKM